MKLLYQWMGSGVIAIILSACGGGDTEIGTGQNSSTKSPEVTVQAVVDELSVDKTTLKVSNGIVSVPLEDSIDLNLTKEDSGPVGVFNEANNPILLGRKLSGDDSVEISLESSAEVFVLYHPIFNGTQSSDPKELSRRIRSHSSFDELVQALKYEIDHGNPCPLNPVCSPKVADIAIDIAETISTDGLYK